jgi:hypothetical protein
MKKFKKLVLALALVASTLMPTIQLVGGQSLAEMEVGVKPAYACENPLPSGGCG